MDKRYEEYLKEVEEMIQAGLLKNYTPKSFEEWHRSDYLDRIESYWMAEYNGNTFPDEVWEDGYDTDSDLDAKCEQLQYRITDLINDCYEKQLPIPLATRKVWKVLRSNKV